MLGDAEKIVELLRPEDFYSTIYQKIFRAVCGLIGSGMEVDLPSLTIALKEAGKLEEIGGASYLSTFIDRIPIAANIEHYAGKIRDKAVLRHLMSALQATISECFSNSDDSLAIIDRARGQLDSIAEEARNLGKSRSRSYRELSLEAADRYSDLHKRKGAITGVSTGFYILDSMLCGMQHGDLITLAARPSQGKTALAQNIAGHVASEGVPVAYYSLEMSDAQIYDRQVSGESEINLLKFRTGRFDEDDWPRLHEAQEKLYKWPVFVDDSPALHYQEIRRRAWGDRKSHGIGLIIIDHLQLVQGDRNTTRDREIGGITAALKAMAKDLNLPVILLSQLNRQLETRPNPHKRPKLSDLRDSGNIEQDSDVVIFLYRPSVYGDQEDFPGHSEVIVSKHRNGPTGLIKLRWNEKLTRFTDLE